MKKLFPLYWILLAGAILASDYVTGAGVRLDILLVFPVALAAWFNGRLWGLAIASTAPLVRLSFYYSWTSPVNFSEAIINTAIRLFTYSAFAVLIDLVAKQRAKIRVLEGFLPTCAHCKNIRDADGKWHRIETYIMDRTDAKFSHGICPECGEKHYGIKL